jgi:hypothetical protein
MVQNRTLACVSTAGLKWYIYFAFPLEDVKMQWSKLSTIDVDAHGEHWRVVLRSVNSMSTVPNVPDPDIMKNTGLVDGVFGTIGWGIATARWGVIVASAGKTVI